ncbi:MAG: hypothetical protein WA510_17045 [Acidobacteriaceae bacterium]
MTTPNQDVSSQPEKSCQMNSNNAVLSSWKEIAQYFGKGVRTVQRWEKEFGLPIRRTKHATKSTILCFTNEIDEWVRAQRFADGRSDPGETQRAALLQIIAALQAEVGELRRQLGIDYAKSA